MLKLARYLKPYLLAVVAVAILVFLQSISQLYLPNLMSEIVDVGIVSGDSSFILRVGGRMLLVAALGAACTIGASYLSARTSAAFGSDLRLRMFEKVSAFSLSEFDRIGTASLITRTTNDIMQMQQVVVFGLRMALMAPMMLIGGIVMAVSTNPGLTMSLAAVIPVLALIMALVGGKGMPLFRAMQAKLDTLNRVLREHLTGIRVIRAFNRGAYEERRFDEANYELTQTAIRVNRLMAVVQPIFILLFNFMALAILWFGGLRVDQGGLQVGNLMAFIQYAMQILSSLVMLSMMFVMLPRASVSANRINEVLDMEPEIVDPPVAKEPERRGVLEFKEVTFSYPGAEQPALKDISFKAEPGQVTAIIGGTGSGKSTLLNLIVRFYDVDAGGVYVDRVDVRQLTQSDLRSRIGLVPQTAVLFSGSVEENIRYGKTDASAEEIEEAARIAQASEFITGMPEGFEAAIAQSGTNLSGGQKQRLSIARALVRRPEIYLLDDSFSALDYRTDARLRAALRRDTAQATVVIVAQRVSTVMDADQIIVLDEGRIVGKGRHQELLKSCAVYREIVASQLVEEELA